MYINFNYVIYSQFLGAFYATNSFTDSHGPTLPMVLIYIIYIYKLYND